MKPEQIRSLVRDFYLKRAAADLPPSELGRLLQELRIQEPPVEVFPLACANLPETPAHSHSFLEILYCQSAFGITVWMDSQSFHLSRGDILLVPPGYRHSACADATNALRGCCLWISMEFINLLREGFPFIRRYSAIDRSRLCFHTADTSWEFLENYFRFAITEAQRRSPGYESALVSVTIGILTELTRAVDSSIASPSPAPDVPLIQRLLDYIDQNLFEKFTVETVANHFLVSKSTIEHLFSREKGISLHKYVTKRRLEEARRLITENIPIEQASSYVGFGDYSAFYRAFRREFGISPKEFRTNG